MPDNPYFAAQLADLMKGELGMIVTGCVSYMTFGKPHHSQYCLLERSLPDHTIKATACEKGSYAD